MRFLSAVAVGLVFAACGAGPGGIPGLPGVPGGPGPGGPATLSDAGASGSGGGSFGGGGSGGGSGGGFSSGTAGGAGGGSSGVGGGSGSGGFDAGTIATNGVLTAGAWDDNLNFDFYLSYLGKKAQEPGAPVFPRADRLVVWMVDMDGNPLPGARVSMTKGGVGIASTITGADGRALFFPAAFGLQKGDAIGLSATAGVISAPVATAQALAGDQELTVTASSFLAPALTAIEIAVVLDTTGSMGDEITWLKSELTAIASTVTAQFPGITQRYALITYKDHGDPYVTKTRNFTTISAFQTQLAGESAGGGGDWPEAVPEALAEIPKLSWSSGPTARMVFHVADAPHHTGEEAKVVTALNAVRALGVHVYPIAASGVNDLTELVMRTEAQVTGGRYLFLTDDSGVGGAHQEPTLPCYRVTKLDKAMLRMIQMELTGLKIEPKAEDVIRTGGNPQDGRCQLTSGDYVFAL